MQPTKLRRSTLFTHQKCYGSTLFLHRNLTKIQSSPRDEVKGNHIYLELNSTKHWRQNTQSKLKKQFPKQLERQQSSSYLRVSILLHSCRVDDVNELGLIAGKKKSQLHKFKARKAQPK